MNAADTVALTLAITRSILLIVCELAAILCIYLRWRLYLKAVTSNTQGELSVPGFKLKLASGGPGIFLCGYGVWLLLSVANHPFETTTSEPIARIQPPDAEMQGSAFTPSGWAMVPLANHYTVSATQATTPTRQPSDEKRYVCLVRTVTTRMDIGLQLTAADVEQAARAAATGIRKAGRVSLADDEERAATVRVLDQLATDAAISHEPIRP